MKIFSINYNSLSLDQSFVDRNRLRNTREKFSSWSEHRSVAGLYAFLIFTSLSITVGVLVVCLTSQRETDKTCQLFFKRSVQGAIGYDSRPRHVAVGDFNKDSHLDIVVANSGTDNIGLFLGYGNGTFDSQITYSTGLGSHPYSVAVGDFNNDTLSDIVVANYGINSIGVLLGYRNGTFANQVITSLGSSQPLSLAIGDFNKDNHLDIAVANYGTFTIAILLGSNDGSFRIDANYDMGYDSIPYSLIISDFNKDNRSDIAIVNYDTNNLVILLANNNESFISQKYSTGHGSHPCSVVTGDFNNDNTSDIAITNSDTSNVGIFLGLGNGTFTNMIIHSTGLNSRPQFIIIDYLNNDTTLDIIVVDSGNNNVIVLNGDGNGNFSIITIHSTGYNSDPSSIAIGDFDNDNKPDLVVTNNATNNILTLTAYDVYPAANQTTYSTGENSEPISVAVGDLNNDNLSDIVVANNGSDSVGIFINLGNGTFGNQIEYPTGNGSQPSYVAVNDVNNDNQLDIIVVMRSLTEIRILFGHGNGIFSYGDSYLTGNNSYPQSFAVGDLNNDSNVDIIVANYQTGNIGVLYGYDHGTFKNVTLYSIEINFHPVSVIVNDLNNDKILDIVACDDILGGIAILLGYGNGYFDIPLIVSTDDNLPCSLAMGDLNNDHRLDIVYVSSSLSTIGVLLGYGNGTFGNATIYYTEYGSWPYSVILVDLNNDTLLDIVLTYAYDYNIGVFFGFGNGSFEPQKTFSTGFDSIPTSIACSDFNNDNQLDIVVSNYGADNIGVSLVHYEMDFIYERSYVTGSGSHPYSVAIGNFNKDEQSDIVVANSGNDNIQLLLGYNKGTFISNRTYSTGSGSYPQFVRVADFNRDNQLDIVVANNRNGTINVFLGHSNGTFDEPNVYSTGSDSFPSSIAVGDFNKDNWTDIVIANNGTNNIGVFFGFDYATFTNETIDIPGPSSVPLDVAAGDFNNDDQWDIVVANAQIQSVGIYLGYGNGTFAKQRSFSTGMNSPNSLAVADFNGDKQLDLVVTYRDENSIGVFMGYGNGNFQTQTIYYTGQLSYPWSVAVGDFNQDNILDIVVANRGTNNIGVFIGYGDGSFKEQIPYLIPDRSSPAGVTVADLNKDNILDIIVANYAQDNIGVFFGYSNGTFGDMMKIFTGDNSRPYSIATGDINNDTWIDIAVTNSKATNVGIFFGFGNGTFSSQITYSTGSQSDLYSISIADLNNDTKLDIIFSDLDDGNDNIGVFYGYGDGNFTLRKTYSTGLYTDPTSFVICDFNNDDQPDLAITYANQDSIGIMLRYKSEPFATSVMFPTGDNSQPKSVAIGDFNNDDQLDIVIANSGTNNIGILLGNDNGTFVQQQTYSTGDNSEPISIALGDFNNDNYLDIVVANSKTSSIVIFRGYGNGTIAVLATYSTGISSAPSSIAVKDLNKDNYLDIVVTNFGSNDVLVFLGSNNGTFLASKPYSLGYDARPQSVAIGDINNDTLFDIIVANYGTDYVEILLQTC